MTPERAQLIEEAIKLARLSGGQGAVALDLLRDARDGNKPRTLKEVVKAFPTFTPQWTRKAVRILRAALVVELTPENTLQINPNVYAWRDDAGALLFPVGTALRRELDARRVAEPEPAKEICEPAPAAPAPNGKSTLQVEKPAPPPVVEQVKEPLSWEDQILAILSRRARK